MKTILMLEDNADRIAGFHKAIAGLAGGFELKIWRDAPSMMAECAEFFPTQIAGTAVPMWLQSMAPVAA